MSIYYKTNINNINKFNFLNNPFYCDGDQKKNGLYKDKPLYKYSSYNTYLCLINKIKYSDGLYFPYLYF